LIYSFNISKRIFECEVWGKRVEFNLFKRRYENIKLIREVFRDEMKILAEKEESKLGYRLSEALFPYNPLQYKGKVTEREIELLKKWASFLIPIMDSNECSVWYFIVNSIRHTINISVGNSVMASVRDSIMTSIMDSFSNSFSKSIRSFIGISLWAYMSSLFLNIKKWAYVEHIEGENPYQPCIDLWKSNLIPSFDGKIWRLHTGPKAVIVYESK